MSKVHNQTPSFPKGTAPLDGREVLQWFVDNFKLYIGSPRGLLLTEWQEERQTALEAAVMNLKSRGLMPLLINADTLYRQADYLWKESRTHAQFGRPLASKVELEVSGSDLVIIDSFVAPENARQLWYLYAHVMYPRAIAGKATILATHLSMQELRKQGEACQDPDFRGKGLNWERLMWLVEATTISLDHLNELREQSLPPMLKAEHELYTALRERNLAPTIQHVLGDFILDFALVEKERKLNIEVDNISTLGGVELQRQEAKRNLVLFADEWQVLKFTTGEILANKGACADVVDEVWRSGRKRGTAGRVLTGNTVAPMPDLPVDDDTQHHAITYGGGPVAIAGGAGTGKTTCLLQRIVYLLGQGINAENILVLTFATDTQRALKRSIEGLIEKQAAQRLGIFSWHDFGLRILKENLPLVKRKPPLKVETSPQKIIQRLLTKAKKDIDPAKLELSVDLDEFYIAAVISMYKSHLITPKQAKEEASNYGEEIIAKIYQALEDQLQKANKVDRDDVIAMATTVLLENPEVRSRYQRQYEFVLVDEYQDVTVAQDMLARLLAAPQDNLFIAGDEDETVAEAKNACPELFTEVSLRSPQTRCYVLERNWRSHPAIVDHARQLLAGLTRRRMQKEFQSAWGQAPATAIIGPAALNDEREEAAWVASEIQQLSENGRNYGDIAVLFRHHVYASILEEALDQRGVRYQASNPIHNFIPDEVEDMTAFLKLVIDPDGPRARESFERICQLRVKEIDPKLSATIASFAEANNLSYLKAVEIYSEATADQSCRELEQLVRVIRTMHSEKLPPAETIALIRRTQRLNDYYRSVKVPPGLNYEPLKKLTQLEEESRAFTNTSEFVRHITNHKQSGTGVADAGVQVLPILESKGLEFPVVFLVGMAEGIFPSQTAIDVEEERRICYVGFTRAKELLYLSYPVMFSGAMLQPSHFLVDARLMATPAPGHYAPAHVDTQGAEVAGQLSPEQMQEQYAAQQYAAQQQQYAEQQYAAQQQQYAQQLAQQQYAEQLAQQQLAQQQLAQQQYAEQLAQQQYAEQLAQQQYAQQVAAQQAAMEAQRQAEAEQLAAQQRALAEQELRRAEAEQIAAQQRAAEEAARRQAESEQLAAQQRAAEDARRQAEAQHLAAQQAAEESQRRAAEEAAQQQRAATEEARRQAEAQKLAAQKKEAEEAAARRAQDDAATAQHAAAVPTAPGREEQARGPAHHAAQEETLRAAEMERIAMQQQGAEIDKIAAAQKAAQQQQAAARHSGQHQAVPGQLAPHVAEEPPLTRADKAAAGAPPTKDRTRPGRSGAQTESQDPVVPAVQPHENVSATSQPAAGAPKEDPFQIHLAPESRPQRGRPPLPRPKAEPVRTDEAPAPAEPAAQEEVTQPAAKPTGAPPRRENAPVKDTGGFIKPAAAQPDYMNTLWGDDNESAGSQPNVPAQSAPYVHPSQQSPFEHAAQPSSFEHAAQPSSFEHAAQPSSFEHAPQPSPFEHPSQQSPFEHAPQPAVAESFADQQHVHQQAPQPDFFDQHSQAQQQIAQNAHANQWAAQQQNQPASASYDQYQQPGYPAQPETFQYQNEYVQHHQYAEQPYPYAQQGAADYHQAQVPQSDGSHPMCPSCHAHLEANARFCGECGYTLPERVPACPTCGCPLESSAKFCGECGTPLNAPVMGSDSHLNGNVTRMQELKDKQHGWMNKVLKMLE